MIERADPDGHIRPHTGVPRDSIAQPVIHGCRDVLELNIETNVVVLSESFWREKFGGALDVVGKTIIMDGRAHTITGVMPQSAAFPTKWHFWKPIEYTPAITSPQNVFALWPNVPVQRSRPRSLDARAAGAQDAT